MPKGLLNVKHVQSIKMFLFSNICKVLAPLLLMLIANCNTQPSFHCKYKSLISLCILIIFSYSSREQGEEWWKFKKKCFSWNEEKHSGTYGWFAKNRSNGTEDPKCTFKIKISKSFSSKISFLFKTLLKCNFKYSHKKIRNRGEIIEFRQILSAYLGEINCKLRRIKKIIRQFWRLWLAYFGHVKWLVVES